MWLCYQKPLMGMLHHHSLAYQEYHNHQYYTETQHQSMFHQIGMFVLRQSQITYILINTNNIKLAASWCSRKRCGGWGSIPEPVRFNAALPWLDAMAKFLQSCADQAQTAEMGLSVVTRFSIIPPVQ